MTNLNQLPTDLPIPQDDGSTNHLKGMKLPPISLNATNGKTVNLGDIKGKLVIYCYPMTGQPNVALPDGWDQIPGQEAAHRKVAHFEITIKSCKHWAQRSWA
jgi:hypothetical protein